jgi:hypothetical protein
VWPQWLTDALTGKISLSRAFWIYGVGVSVAYSLIAAFIDIENRMALTAYVLIGLLLGVLQSVILWRSALHSPYKFLGRVIRTALIAALIIVVPLTIYLLFTNPELLLPPNNRWRGP